MGTRMDERTPDGRLIDRSWDQLPDEEVEDYAPLLDRLASAGEAAGLPEGDLTVEVVYPKVHFNVGDLVIEAGSREYDDYEPRPGFWASAWDAVSTVPFPQPSADADTPEALFAAYIPMLVAAGLVAIEDGKVVRSKGQRKRLRRLVAVEEARFGR